MTAVDHSQAWLWSELCSRLLVPSLYGPRCDAAPETVQAAGHAACAYTADVNALQCQLDTITVACHTGSCTGTSMDVHTRLSPGECSWLEAWERRWGQRLRWCWLATGFHCRGPSGPTPAPAINISHHCSAPQAAWREKGSSAWWCAAWCETLTHVVGDHGACLNCTSWLRRGAC